jgi:hypothetical protein
MWTSFACAVGLMALAPGQADRLKLTNARFTYGPLGMEHTITKIVPGDAFYLAFDIENAKARNNTINYDMLLEFVDSKDKVIFSQNNENNKVLNLLAGSRQPSYASVVIGTDTKPGKYTLRVTVRDRIAKKRARLTREFEVIKKTFAIVQLQAQAMRFVREPFQLVFRVEGFERNTKKLPEIVVTMTIVDEAGKATMAKPITMKLPPEDLSDEVEPQNVTSWPVQLAFPLNRAGKFTIKLEATDKVAKKTIKLPYKITVLDTRKYESGE